MKTSCRSWQRVTWGALGAAAFSLGACSSDDSSPSPVADAAASDATPLLDGGAPANDDAAPVDAAPGSDAAPFDAAPGTDAASPPGDAGPATVVFSNVANPNAITTDYSAVSSTSASATKSQTEVTVYPTGGGVRTAVFYLESAYAAGSSYALGSPYDNLPEQAHLAYTDKNGQWFAESGTITVESAGPTQFVFHVRDAAMTPVFNDSSVGTFTLTMDGPTKVN